jgi:hypothetical protein
MHGSRLFRGSRFLLLVVGLPFISATLVYGEQDTRYKGQPPFEAGMTRRFVIWEDGGEFKLRTTTRQMLNRFSGAIYAVNGTFSDVRMIRRDPGDFVKISRDKKRIFFSFLTKKGVDGLNFKTDAKRLAFGLRINRRSAAKNLEIFLGTEGKHPLHNPFMLFLGEAAKDDNVTGVSVDETKDEGELVTEVVQENELEDAAKVSD